MRESREVNVLLVCAGVVRTGVVVVRDCGGVRLWRRATRAGYMRVRHGREESAQRPECEEGGGQDAG